MSCDVASLMVAWSHEKRCFFTWKRVCVIMPARSGGWKWRNLAVHNSLSLSSLSDAIRCIFQSGETLRQLRREPSSVTPHRYLTDVQMGHSVSHHLGHYTVMALTLEVCADLAYFFGQAWPIFSLIKYRFIPGCSFGTKWGTPKTDTRQKNSHIICTHANANIGTVIEKAVI